MGAALIIPESDDRMEKLVDLFALTDVDLALFYRLFAKLDIEKSGFVSISSIFECCEFQRNMFTDSFLELLDIDYIDGEINFTEFLDVIMTYCMFERNEILKFCLYMFDDDKAAAITEVDLKQLLDVIHNIVEAGDHMRGNPRQSWNQLTFSDDGIITFEDLIEMNNTFPTLLAPIFMLQAKMMVRFQGEIWWNNKKNLLLVRNEDKAIEDEEAEKKKLKNSTETKARNRKIKRNMGLLMYLLCPCWHHHYDPTPPIDFEGIQKAKDEEDRLLKQLVKQQQLASKNPETAAWKKFKKMEQMEGGTTEYIINQHIKTEKHRDARVESRADRRAKRKNDDDLRHKFKNGVT